MYNLHLGLAASPLFLRRRYEFLVSNLTKTGPIQAFGSDIAMPPIHRDWQLTEWPKGRSLEHLIASKVNFATQFRMWGHFWWSHGHLSFFWVSKSVSSDLQDALLSWPPVNNLTSEMQRIPLILPWMVKGGSCRGLQAFKVWFWAAEKTDGYLKMPLVRGNKGRKCVFWSAFCVFRGLNES